MIEIKIDYLKNHPEHVPLLASWMFNTWGHYNPSSSLEKAELKLNEHLHMDSLPIAYIALKNDEPVGMCSLRLNDGIREDLMPWLGSLFVVPHMRGQGIGEQLIHIVTEKAHSLSYSKLYLLAFDQTLPLWYAKLGWRVIGPDELFGHAVQVMEFSK
ncbi:MAG: GNAT family N-acetyltransferase [Gammaproteobacteria bacterium]|jgi:N-acetylglutamate synthase-like GNAT family acetyltransferase|nr:GNAT family N-acetyltransferase [Gammaproteobacteria bacterium]